ncbi:hypothetical protein [Georgenia satyanarayanai]|uniref:hypothetical protein n=1 Tax=Georgenia satyanarayanai TaxID=860221 RepID=UPI0012643E20|nr:hypothetical protein [Georgenia satyanarayanai]
MTARRRPAAILVVAALALAVGGCAAGVNAVAEPGGAGFWLGLWHGIILPITFIVSLFTDTVNIYEVDNNGNWYDFGFVLGLALFSGPAMALRGRR